MKKSYFLVMTLLLMVVAVGLVSCGDDDEGGAGVSPSALLGEWQSTYEYAYEVDEGETIPLEDGPYTDDEWTFYEDGTMYWYDNYYGDGIHCDWRVDGNKLYLTDYEDGEPYTDEYVIESLSSDEMVVSITERDGDYMLYDRITFRRIE